VSDPFEVTVAGLEATFAPGVSFHVLEETGSPQSLTDFNPDLTVQFGSDVDPTTPLPATIPLFATGLGGLGLLGWRRKRKAQVVA